MRAFNAIIALALIPPLYGLLSDPVTSRSTLLTVVLVATAWVCLEVVGGVCRAADVRKWNRHVLAAAAGSRMYRRAVQCRGNPESCPGRP